MGTHQGIWVGQWQSWWCALSEGLVAGCSSANVAGLLSLCLSLQALQAAPWEARTPDLEVNSLTLWPAELRKLLVSLHDAMFI